MTQNNIQDVPDSGVLNIEYADQRDRKFSVRYRLRRRTLEVKNAIREYYPGVPDSLIDLGTADAKMLNELSLIYPDSRCTGIEYNSDLIGLGRRRYPNLELIQGDVLNLDFVDEQCYSVVVATAIIEHLSDPVQFLREAKRILKKGGIIVLSAPDPFWEHIATMVGHLDEEQHHLIPDLKMLKGFAMEAGLEVLHSKKFMISPVGFPGEQAIEKVLRMLRLNFLMANQLVIARRVN